MLRHSSPISHSFFFLGLHLHFRYSSLFHFFNLNKMIVSDDYELMVVFLLPIWWSLTSWFLAHYHGDWLAILLILIWLPHLSIFSFPTPYEVDFNFQHHISLISHFYMSFSIDFIEIGYENNGHIRVSIWRQYLISFFTFLTNENDLQMKMMWSNNFSDIRSYNPTTGEKKLWKFISGVYR